MRPNYSHNSTGCDNLHFAPYSSFVKIVIAHPRRLTSLFLMYQKLVIIHDNLWIFHSHIKINSTYKRVSVRNVDKQRRFTKRKLKLAIPAHVKPIQHKEFIDTV